MHLTIHNGKECKTMGQPPHPQTSLAYGRSKRMAITCLGSSIHMGWLLVASATCEQLHALQYTIAAGVAAIAASCVGWGNWSSCCLQLGFASKAGVLQHRCRLLIASCVANFAAHMINSHGVHKHVYIILWLCVVCVVLPCYYFVSVSCIVRLW